MSNTTTTTVVKPKCTKCKKRDAYGDDVSMSMSGVITTFDWCFNCNFATWSNYVDREVARDPGFRKSERSRRNVLFGSN